METLAPTSSVTRDDLHSEVHYSARGLWTQETIIDLQKQLFAASKPFIDAGKPFRVLGDLQGFPVQTREIAGQMEQIQIASAQLGVERMALIIDSILVQQQFRRVSQAINLAMFEARAAALAWLRQS